LPTTPMLRVRAQRDASATKRSQHLQTKINRESAHFLFSMHSGFVIYRNDIDDSVGSRIIKFANDTKIHNLV